MEALVESDATFTDRFGVPVVAGWAGFSEAIPFALDAARAADRALWGPYLFFDGEGDGQLVGFGGFKGPPVDGAVEIGYAIAPPRQGRGLATAATRLMIDIAARADIRVVVAHTLAEHDASTAVLARCGFAPVGTEPDPDGEVDEKVWRWELSA